MMDEDDPMWARVDVDFYDNKKIIRAGLDAAHVFLWVLFQNQRHGCDGKLPADFADLGKVSKGVGMAVDRAEAALLACMSKDPKYRLLEIGEDGSLLIYGWSDDWRPKAATNVERQQKYRRVHNVETGRIRDDSSDNVTDVTAPLQPLLDLRSEIREEDLETPLPPSGERRRSRQARRAITAEAAQVTADFVVWFNQRFSTCFETDSEETQKLVGALLAKGKGKWGLDEMKAVAGFHGDLWRQPPGRGEKDMSIHVKPSAMLRASKFEEKLATVRSRAPKTVDSAQVQRLHAAVPELADFIRTGTVTPVAPIRSAPAFPVTKGRVAPVPTSEQRMPELPLRGTAPATAPAGGEQPRGGPPRKPPVAALLLKGRSS